MPWKGFLSDGVGAGPHVGCRGRTGRHHPSRVAPIRRIPINPRSNPEKLIIGNGLRAVQPMNRGVQVARVGPVHARVHTRVHRRRRSHRLEQRRIRPHRAVRAAGMAARRGSLHERVVIGDVCACGVTRALRQEQQPEIAAVRTDRSRPQRPRERHRIRPVRIRRRRIRLTHPKHRRHPIQRETGVRVEGYVPDVASSLAGDACISLRPRAESQMSQITRKREPVVAGAGPDHTGCRAVAGGARYAVIGNFGARRVAAHRLPPDPGPIRCRRAEHLSSARSGPGAAHPIHRRVDMQRIVAVHAQMVTRVHRARGAQHPEKRRIRTD